MNYCSHNVKFVIVIGIPFASLKEIKLKAKKKYLEYKNNEFVDFFKNEKIKPVIWKDWYTLNAVKSVNQSIGRLIRSNKDYGSIILIDKRYTDINIRKFISDWINNYAVIYKENKIEDFIDDLKRFFDNSDIFLE